MTLTMRNYGLVFPKNYVCINEIEMEYIGGGWSIPNWFVGVVINVAITLVCGGIGASLIVVAKSILTSASKYEDNLAIMWYDEENAFYKVLEDSVLDKENNTVSVNTTHFSTYMVVDRIKWFEAWSVQLNYVPVSNIPKNYNTVLVLDCSGSMSSNDRISYTYPSSSNPNIIKSCYRISAATNYINSMNNDDKAAILLFDSNSQFARNMTNDKADLKYSLQQVYSSGGTNFNSALSSSIAELNSYNDATDKIIILMSDGYSYPYLSDTYLQQAKDSHIRIYTVGLGSSVDTEVLQHIADYTNGEYFKAITGSDLIDIYSKIGTVKDFDLTDTDGDGLADIFESAGMKLANGKIIYSDPTKYDTDGDGLKDGSEISPKYKYIASFSSGIPEQYFKDTAGIYFEMTSHPMEEDTDGDGLLDGKATYVNSKKVAPKDPNLLIANGPVGIWQAQIVQEKMGIYRMHIVIILFCPILIHQ